MVFFHTFTPEPCFLFCHHAYLMFLSPIASRQYHHSIHPTLSIMKTSFRFIWIIGLVYFLTGCVPEPQEAVVSGTYSGHPIEKIQFTTPVNGVTNRFFSDVTEVCPEGNFRFTVTTDRPVFVNLNFYGAPSLIVEPGGTYHLELLLDPDQGFEMNGNFSDIQAFYNTFNHEDPRSCVYNYSDDISNYRIVNEGLLADLEEEMQKIDAAYESGKLPREFHELMRKDRKLYYQVARIVVASANYLRMMSDDRQVHGEVFEIWEDAIASVSTNNPLFFTSLQAYDHLLFTYWYHTYTDPAFDYDEFRQTRAAKREAREVHAHTLDRAPEFFSGKALEFFMAAYLTEQFAIRQPHDELPGVIAGFANQYPDSDYLVFLEKMREKLEDERNQ